jgi:hypothetical protein
MPVIEQAITRGIAALPPEDRASTCSAGASPTDHPAA